MIINSNLQSITE
jgi:chromosome segregation ATPase